MFEKLTIEQLDKVKELLQALGTDIVTDCTEFVSAYFSKVFSTELMLENQEIMSRREKFDTLMKLY